MDNNKEPASMTALLIFLKLIRTEKLINAAAIDSTLGGKSKPKISINMINCTIK